MNRFFPYVLAVLFLWCCLLQYQISRKDGVASQAGETANSESIKKQAYQDFWERELPNIYGAYNHTSGVIQKISGNELTLLIESEKDYSKVNKDLSPEEQNLPPLRREYKVEITPQTRFSGTFMSISDLNAGTSANFQFDRSIFEDGAMKALVIENSTPTTPTAQ